VYETEDEVAAPQRLMDASRGGETDHLREIIGGKCPGWFVGYRGEG
jgi:hypothetical protein